VGDCIAFSVVVCVRELTHSYIFSFVHCHFVFINTYLFIYLFIYVSFGDLEEPLTPSHLLVGRRLLSLPDDLCYTVNQDDEEFTITDNALRKRAKHLNNITKYFWGCWSKEYL